MLELTFTVTVQEPDRGTVPPEKVRVPPPAVAAGVPPAQVVAAPGGAALTSPLG